MLETDKETTAEQEDYDCGLRTYADPGLTAIDDRQLIEDPDM